MATALQNIITNNNPNRRVCAKVILNARVVDPRTILEVPEVTTAIGQMVASATVVLSSLPSGFEHEQAMEVHLGWDGLTQIAFKGTVRGDECELEGGVYTLRGYGFMSRTEAAPELEDGLAWTNATGDTIIGDCLAAAGVPEYSFTDGWATFGIEEDFVLAQYQPYSGAINKVNEIERRYTIDCPDGVVRTFSTSRIPSAGVVRSYVEGSNMIGKPKRVESSRDVRNRIVVEGYQDADIYSARSADSPYVPDPPGHIPWHVSDNEIQEQTTADTLAELLMYEKNRKVDEWTLQVPGDPYLMPGMTVNVHAPTAGCAANYWINRVTHRVNHSDGFITDLGLEGGIGDTGYAEARPPMAMFTYTIERQGVVIGGVATTIYVITCTNATVDFDSPPESITLAWSNNKTADTGTGQVYTVILTEAQMQDATAPTITLVATDETALTDTCAKTLNKDDPLIIVHKFYHAFYTRAEASQDGGITWNTWTPGGGVYVISTPPIAAEGFGLFGLSDGKLYKTLDYLASAPTLVRDFASAVNCVWVCESESTRWTVGLANGQVWASADSGATWAMLTDYPNAVVWVEESYSQTQYRVCTATTELIVNGTAFSAALTGASWAGGVAQKSALSFDINVASGTPAAAESPVKQELGAEIAVPAGVVDVQALSHDVYEPVIYATDRGGRFLLSEVAAGVGAAFVEGVAVPGATGVNYSQRDGYVKGIVYVCDEHDLQKCPNALRALESPAANGWYIMRAGNGTTLRSKMLGYESKPMTMPETPMTGRRVYVGGAGGKVFWCDNVFATTPAWSDISTGLPAKYITSLKLDPRDATWNSGYCIAGDSYGGRYFGNAALYYNPALRTGGAWSCVLNKAIVESYVGALDDVQVRAFDVTPTGDVLYANVWAALLGHDSIPNGFDKRQWLFHSHDHGATWTVTAYGPAYGFWVGNSGTAPVIALQRVANAAMFAIGYNGAPVIYRTTDGGHTIQTCGSLGGTGCTGIDCFRIPGTGNDSEQEIILVDGIHANNGTYRTTNFGTSWAAYKKSNYGLNFWQPNDGNIVWAFEVDFDRNIYKSTDRGLSFTAQGTVGIGANRELSLFGKADGTARLYMVGSPDAEHDDQIQTSEDGVSWTVRVGDMPRTDLHTVTVDPSV